MRRLLTMLFLLCAVGNLNAITPSIRDVSTGYPKVATKVTLGTVGYDPGTVAWGTPGTPVMITGSGFGETQGGNSVTFAGVEAQVTFWTPNLIEALVPTGKPGAVVVWVNGTPSTDKAGFIITRGPAVTRCVQGRTPPVGNFETDDGQQSPQNSAVTFSGWAADLNAGSPVQRVEIMVDGVHLGNATLGQPREDIRDLYGKDSFLNAGWQYDWQLGVFAAGSHTITAVAYNSLNLLAVLGTKTFTVDPPGSIPNIVGHDYTTTYTYNALDNLTDVQQAGDDPSAARLRHFEYDSLGRLTSAQNPESGTISYGYDANGNLISKVSPLANQRRPSDLKQTICYGYDELNRLTGKKYLMGDQASQCGGQSSWDVTYSYDQGAGQVGRRTGMQDQSGSTAWTYDAMGRLSTEYRAIGGVAKSVGYTYLKNGAVQTITYPSGRELTYGYDTIGQPTSASDASGTYVSDAQYWPHGALWKMNYGSSTSPANTLEVGYNERLQPSVITANQASPSNTLLSLTYGYGAPGQNNGNVTNLIDGLNDSRTQTFTYDALNRLQTAYTNGNIYGDHYEIDGWGNLVGIDAYNGKWASRAIVQNVNAMNQIIGQDYDIAGNVLSDGGHQYRYNPENLISQVDANLSYTYDGDGQRVKKSSGRLYWAGSSADALAESDLSGNLTSEYVFFGGKRVARIDSPTQTPSVHYYIGDHLGSARLVTNSAGAVEEESFYAPFGSELQGQYGLNHYKFTAKERDTETGNDYFGARYYGSNMGRFMSADPVFMNASRLANPNALNLYSYARNNPLSLVDPTGLEVRMANDTEEGKKKALEYQRKGMTATEAGNIGYHKDKNGNTVMYVKNAGAVDMSKASTAYKELAGRIGSSTVFNYGVVGNGLTATFPGIGQVSNWNAVGGTGIEPNGQVNCLIDRSASIQVKVFGGDGGEVLGDEPAFMTAMHELLGETLKYTAGHSSLRSDQGANSATVIGIENAIRSSLSMPLRTGSDHQQPVAVQGSANDVPLHTSPMPGRIE